MYQTHLQRELDVRFEQLETQGLLVIPSNRVEEKCLHDRVRAGALVAPYPGMFARRVFWDLLEKSQRARAMCIVRTYAKKHPDCVFCGVTAALVHGLWLPNSLLGTVHVMASAGCHGKKYGHVSIHAVREPEVVQVAGLKATSLRQTLFDCARSLSFAEALAPVDCALRHRGMDPAALASYAQTHGRWLRGTRRALDVFTYADARSENGGESITRGLIIEKGYLPPTELQFELRDPIDPTCTYRADMFWTLPNGRCIIGELDGFEKYSNKEMLAGRTAVEKLVAERQRESRITALGMPVMRILFKNVSLPGYLEQTLDAYGIPRSIPGLPSN